VGVKIIFFGKNMGKKIVIKSIDDEIISITYAILGMKID